MFYHAYGMTDKGACREENQDTYLIEQFPFGTLAVVFDGMGGEVGGKVAAETAKKAFLEAFRLLYLDRYATTETSESIDMRDSANSNTTDTTVTTDTTGTTGNSKGRDNLTAKDAEFLLKGALWHANRTVYTLAQSEGNFGMGTTIAGACVLPSGEAILLHVGDSRVYHLGDKCRRITTDHSYVQMLLDDGEITKEQARSHPKRNMITRAVGAKEDVLGEIDILKLQPQSALLLTTVGVSGVLSSQTLYACFAQQVLGMPLQKEKALENLSQENLSQENPPVEDLSLASFPKYLIEKAIAKGSRDNLTAIILCAKKES